MTKQFCYGVLVCRASDERDRWLEAYRNAAPRSSTASIWAAPEFMPDSISLCCSSENCRLPFNFYRWIHHCRNCGKAFCHHCSKDTAVIPKLGMTPVRVCEPCKLQLMDPSAVQRRRSSAASIVSRRSTMNKGAAGSSSGQAGAPSLPDPEANILIDVETDDVLLWIRICKHLFVIRWYSYYHYYYFLLLLLLLSVVCMYCHIYKVQ